MKRERLTRLMSLSLHLRYALTVPYATPSLTFRFRDRKERRNVGRILETRELSAPTRHSSFALHYATAEGPLRGWVTSEPRSQGNEEPRSDEGKEGLTVSHWAAEWA